MTCTNFVTIARMSQNRNSMNISNAVKFHCGRTLLSMNEDCFKLNQWLYVLFAIIPDVMFVVLQAVRVFRKCEDSDCNPDHSHLTGEGQATIILSCHIKWVTPNNINIRYTVMEPTTDLGEVDDFRFLKHNLGQFFINFIYLGTLQYQSHGLFQVIPKL